MIKLSDRGYGFIKILVLVQVLVQTYTKHFGFGFKSISNSSWNYIILKFQSEFARASEMYCCHLNCDSLKNEN